MLIACVSVFVVEMIKKEVPGDCLIELYHRFCTISHLEGFPIYMKCITNLYSQCTTAWP